MTNPSLTSMSVVRPDEEWKQALYAILATSSPVDERKRVLKQGDTFAVLDHYGDISIPGMGEEGLYHDGTRFLSLSLLEVEGKRPLFLSSTVRDDNGQLTVDLTNPALADSNGVRVLHDTLHISLTKLLWQGVYYQQIQIHNYGLRPVTTFLMMHFGADFADIFEVRGSKRPRRGNLLPPEVSDSSVVLGYQGLDGIRRRSILKFEPAPSVLQAYTARFNLNLAPKETQTFNIWVACEYEQVLPTVLPFAQALQTAETDAARNKAWTCSLSSSNTQFNAWLNRAEADLYLLTTQMETGAYPYAGVPWFSTPFGRDGIITALECLWLKPTLARGVLSYLAATQAKEEIPEKDAEPGKILHEARGGEMAALKEIPFGRYYGSIDSTPLFVLLAGVYYERTADREFIEKLWPHIEAALHWIDKYGDIDGDGFVEYQRRTVTGLLQQGWKDSEDSVFYADGTIAEPPIALCEVQGYVYAARKAAAKLAVIVGKPELAEIQQRKAELLRGRFEAAFWCEEISTYALALDGKKRPCQVRASNAGHCLFTGIADPQRAWRVARTLLGEDFYSGWGIRTLTTGEVRYNPMAYHNGSVWPHDNALIGYGFARYGFKNEAVQLLDDLFEASHWFDLNRLPELFCGFPRRAGEGPTLYPVACAPQAWAAAAVYLLVQACLSLEINAPERRLLFTRPRLPASLKEFRILNLEVAGATLDLLLVRHEQEASINVLRRQGEVEIVTIK